MNIKEAKKIAYICSQADMGCSNCAQGLFNLLVEYFPEIKWDFQEEYDENRSYIIVEE